MKKKRLSLNTMKEQVMEKAYPVLCSTGVVFGTMIGNGCYADPSNPSLESVMKKIRNIVYALFQSIGFILVLWGVGQLVLAFKNEDSDSKSRAIMSIVAGVALLVFPSIAKSLGINAPKLNTTDSFIF